MKWLFVMAAAVAFGGASPTTPALPTFIPSGAKPTVTGSHIAVHSGDDLQAKYNAAACGDQLDLDAGVTFTGSYVFNKQCDNAHWLQIVSANLSSIPVPVYVTAASINGSVPSPPSLANYATLTTNSGLPTVALTVQSGVNVPAKYHYIGGLEITSNVSQFFVVSFTSDLSPIAVAELQDHITIDRCYIHGLQSSSTVQMLKGINATGNSIAIVNCYISGIYSFSDSNAIFLRDGGSGYFIDNNYLEASTEIFFMGGDGRTVGYSCTIAPSPAPTTTTITVNTCIDLNGASASSPSVGTYIMVWTGAGAGDYGPKNWVQVTGNTSGALTFSPALSATPTIGAGKVKFGLVNSDVTFTHNFLYRPPSWNPADPSWDGINRTSKNCWEFKYGARINVNGNVCTNSWNAGQQFSMNITAVDQQGDCPWCTTYDVTVTNNVLKNISGMALLIPAQAGVSIPECPGYLTRVLLSNNLFFPVGAAPYIAGTDLVELFGVQGCSGSPPHPGVDSLQITHNNWLGAGNMSITLKGLDGSYDPPIDGYTNLVIQNNLVAMGEGRWAYICTVYPDGLVCMTSTYNTDNTYTIDHNAVVNTGVGNGSAGIDDATMIARYGSLILSTIVDCTTTTNFSCVGFTDYTNTPTNYMGFQLTAASMFHGLASDGKDPGVDLAQLNAALGIAVGHSRTSGSTRVSSKAVIQ